MHALKNKKRKKTAVAGSHFSDSEAIHSTDHILEWLRKKNDEVNVSVEQVRFSDLGEWTYDNSKGILRHVTGKFFSINGIRVNTNWGEVSSWEQPIINQPEIGYLGMIAKEFNGVLHFLMQAKIEPGNVNHVQLSPTLQATKSNYTQVHKGRKPAYLEWFRKASPDQVILDQLQSEQGARFLRKRNRNIIIKIDEDIDVKDEYIWVTLAQLKELIRHDNVLNMDTRTVLSGIPYGTHDDEIVDLISFFKYGNKNVPGHQFLTSALRKDSVHSEEDIIQFITRLKSFYELDIDEIPLKRVANWRFTQDQIEHEKGKFFKVIPVSVEIDNREVNRWTQPMVQPTQGGLCAFVCKELDGILHFAVQAKVECGNFDILELAPTVQCLTGNYRATEEGALPFLDYVLNAPSENVVFDTIQSEEGGRFYKEQNWNRIVIAGDEIGDDLPENYIWMTLNQIQRFLKHNNYLNIQARSLISAISFV